MSACALTHTEIQRNCLQILQDDDIPDSRRAGTRSTMYYNTPTCSAFRRKRSDRSVPPYAAGSCGRERMIRVNKGHAGAGEAGTVHRSAGEAGLESWFTQETHVNVQLLVVIKKRKTFSCW